MKISEHFYLHQFTFSETAIRYGLDNNPTEKIIENLKRLAEVLEDIRAFFGDFITITSGYRSPELNTVIGGSLTSAHMKGLAVDFRVRGKTNLEVCQWIAEHINCFDQVIYEFGEAGWVHLGLTDQPEPRKMKLTAMKTGRKTSYYPGFVAKV